LERAKPNEVQDIVDRTYLLMTFAVDATIIDALGIVSKEGLVYNRLFLASLHGYQQSLTGS